MQQRLQWLLIFKRYTSEITTMVCSTIVSTEKSVVEAFALKGFWQIEHL